MLSSTMQRASSGYLNLFQLPASVWPVPQIGIALAGGSFGNAHSADEYNTGWFYEVDGISRTSNQSFQTVKSANYGSIRVDFNWERLQPMLNQPLDTAEVGRLTAMLNAAHSVGQTVILDCHNYGHYKQDGAPNLDSAQGGWSIGQNALPYSAYADVWQRIATQFGPHPAL